MGKFQLDYREQEKVKKFHDKHSALKGGSPEKLDKIAELREKHLAKQKKKQK